MARLVHVAGFCVLIAATASSQTPNFGYDRPIAPAAKGPQVLPVDATLLGHSSSFRVVHRGTRAIAESGLRDLRIFDSNGRPVPYLLVHPPDTEPAWTRGSLLATPETKRSSGFEVDLGQLRSVDALRVEGIPAPFLKRLTLEGSGDRARWTLLARERTLFDLPAERLRQLEVGFQPGEYRYVRLTWDDTTSGRVPLPEAALLRSGVRVPAPPDTVLDLQFERRESEPGRSRYEVRLPAARLPIVGVRLDVGPGHVFRQAAVTESRLAGEEVSPVELGRSTLSRVEREGMRAANLVIPISPPSESALQVVIDDASNAPLAITGVAAVLATLPFIYFEAEKETLFARYGNSSLEAPTYDLEAVRASVDVTRLPQASWGPERTLPRAAGTPADRPAPQPGSTLDPASFRFARKIPEGGSSLVALRLDSEVLAHSAGPSARFSDVRILDGSNRQIPYVLERRDEPLAVSLEIRPTAESRAVEAKAPEGQRRSLYRVVLPQENLPASTLVLETSARVFRRDVRIGFERPPDRHHRDHWMDARSTTAWRHADPQTPAAALTVRLDSPASGEALIVIDEGDNSPLPLTRARLLLPSYRLRFFRPAETALRLVYGRGGLQAPRYDLSLLSQQVMGAAATEIAPEQEVGRSTPESGDRLVPRAVFWTLLVAAVVVLLGLIARLSRTAGSSPDA